MPKGTRKPVTYAELTIGHWYQARFEFKEQDRITDTTPSATQSTSATRATERNKSHRVMVLTKFTNPEDPADGSATCMFLTSFGGRLDLSDSISNSRNRLKYIPVNSTPPPPTPYSSIPISVRSLHGYVNFVSEYELPVGSGDKAIVRMREAGRGGVDIHSPDWVIRYIRKLKVAWVDWMLQGAIVDKWQDIATAITAEFGQSTVAVAEIGGSVASAAGQDGAKRLRDEEDEKHDEVHGKEEAPVKRSRNSSRWLDGADDTDDSVNYESSDQDAGSRDNSEELGDAAGVGDDSGIQIINFESEEKSEVHALNVQAEIENETEQVKPEPPIYRQWAPPMLLRVEFYELHGDEEDIDEEVDFSLLDALFRPFPEY